MKFPTAEVECFTWQQSRAGLWLLYNLSSNVHIAPNEESAFVCRSLLFVAKVLIVLVTVCKFDRLTSTSVTKKILWPWSYVDYKDFCGKFFLWYENIQSLTLPLAEIESIDIRLFLILLRAELSTICWYTVTAATTATMSPCPTNEMAP